VVKFRHSLDRDRNILPGTTEMAFWLAWKKDHYLQDVEYKFLKNALNSALMNAMDTVLINT